jgi:hypothetical protein
MHRMSKVKRLKMNSVQLPGTKHQVETPHNRKLGPRAKPASQVPESVALQAAIENPQNASPGEILLLQRAYGNYAVSRLIQTKLTVGAASDRYKQEADRVAAQVMTMPASAETQPALQRAPEEEEELQMKPLAAPLAASITPLVQRAPKEEEELQVKPDVQRAASGAGFEVGGEFEQQLVASRGGGSPLPAQVRSFVEPRFGADFSGVRIHTGSESAQLNRSVSAQAFTLGQDIYLGEGKSDIESDEGTQLLAHELTHVVQQSGANNRIQGKPILDRSLGVRRMTLQIQRAIPEIQGSDEKALREAKQDVFSAYRRVIAFEITKIKDQAERETQQSILTVTEEIWNKAVTEGRDKPFLFDETLKKLKRLIVDVNMIIKNQPKEPIRGQPVAEDDESGSKKKTEDLPAKNNRHLDKSIDLIVAKVVNRMKTEVVTDSMNKMFGNKINDAQRRYGEIATELRAIYNRTDDNKRTGFVKDAGLGNMGALAVGQGASAIIKVSPRALRGEDEPHDLAATLAHEGSHVINNPTADFAYKQGGAHYYLPTDVALLNAANYEQVAIDAFQGGEGELTSPAAGLIEQKRDLTERGPGPMLALLRSRVTRAWVRAFELRRPGPRAESPAAAGKIGAPADDNLAITQHIFDALFNDIDMVHSFILSGFDARRTIDEDVTEPVLEKNTVLVPRLWLQTKSAEDITRTVLLMILERLRGKSLFTPEQLADVIMSIETIDRPGIRATLLTYYGKFSKVPALPY